jgi:uncharacterized membrane protein YqjE
MPALWTLRQAAPVLLRHLGAYVELAEQDIAADRGHFAARIGSMTLLIVAVLFALLMGCVAIVAAGWETPHRMTTIYMLLAFFALTSLAALAWTLQVKRRQPPLLASVRREWQLDQVMLERLMSGSDRDANSDRS